MSYMRKFNKNDAPVAAQFMRTRAAKLMDAETLPHELLDRRYESVGSFVDTDDLVNKFRRDVMRDKRNDEIIDEADDPKKRKPSTMLKLRTTGIRYNNYAAHPELDFSDYQPEPTIGSWDQPTNMNKKMHEMMKTGRGLIDNRYMSDSNEDIMVESNDDVTKREIMLRARGHFAKRFVNFKTEDIALRRGSPLYKVAGETDYELEPYNVDKTDGEYISKTTILSNYYPIRGDSVPDHQFDIGSYTKTFKSKGPYSNDRQRIADIISDYKKSRYFRDNTEKNTQRKAGVILLNALTSPDLQSDFKRSEYYHENMTNEQRSAMIEQVNLTLKDIQKDIELYESIEENRRMPLQEYIKPHIVELCKFDLKDGYVRDMVFRHIKTYFPPNEVFNIRRQQKLSKIREVMREKLVEKGRKSNDYLSYDNNRQAFTDNKQHELRTQIIEKQNKLDNLQLFDFSALNHKSNIQNDTKKNKSYFKDKKTEIVLETGDIKNSDIGKDIEMRDQNFIRKSQQGTFSKKKYQANETSNNEKYNDSFDVSLR